MADKKKKSKQKDDRRKEEKQKDKRNRRKDELVASPVQPAAVAHAAKPETPLAVGGKENAILDGVIACLILHGVGGITTRRIAALAGVNEVTLFRRFGNKDALLHAAIQREVQKIDDATQVYTGDLEADLAQIVAVFVGVNERGQALLPAILEAAQREGALGSTPAPSPTMFSAAMQLLERYMRQGTLHIEAPEDALAALVGPIVVRALLQSKSRRNSPTDIASHVQRYLEGRRASEKRPS